MAGELGATVFGGVGEVAPDGKCFSTEDLLPSAGVGLRFNVSKQRRINLRLDLAYSRTGGSWEKAGRIRVTLRLLDHRITQRHLTYR